jgi:hypothetical protein
MPARGRQYTVAPPFRHGLTPTRVVSSLVESMLLAEDESVSMDARVNPCRSFICFICDVHLSDLSVVLTEPEPLSPRAFPTPTDTSGN